MKPDRSTTGTRDMTNKRHFFFGGSAAAIGGLILRPLQDDERVKARGASALTAGGGLSESSFDGGNFAGFVEFRSGTTFAEGVFEDKKRAEAVNAAGQSVDRLRARTTLRASVTGLRVGDAIRFQADEIATELIARTSLNTYESSFEIGKATGFKDLVFSRKGGRQYRLIVEVDRKPFETHDSRLKLIAAAEDEKFLKAHGHRLLLGEPGERGQQRDRDDASPRTLLSSCGVLYATIVGKIAWDPKSGEYPKSTIRGNSVHIPDYGTVYFGELLLSAERRRVIGARFELGSPWGVFLSAAEGSDQPIWYP